MQTLLKFLEKKTNISIFLILFFAMHLQVGGQDLEILTHGHYSFKVPGIYLQERKDIPDFWITTIDDVAEFLYNHVRKGQIKIIGISAGGRPIRAVCYGKSRQGKGTTTFSGSLGFRDLRAYRGPDNDNNVYLGMAAVHGGEFEGIVGIVNLISVIETGKDLRGKEWPEISMLIDELDRMILIPIMNPDGRSRIPLRMEPYRGTDQTVHQYLNCGGYADGTLIGWPQVKEFIPLDFGRPIYPGGYPNDAGVNIQHDDFLGKRQPETQALFDLLECERPDLVLNMHTGAVYPNLKRPFTEPDLITVFDSLYRCVHKRLTFEGLQYIKDPLLKINPPKKPLSFNIDSAINLHCGALSVTVESPSHGFSGKSKDGDTVFMSPDMLLDAQLLIHLEAMKFLNRSGGRSKWTASSNP